MDDVLVIAIIVIVYLVSMIDGAARKRRKQAQSSEHLPESLLERNRLQGAEDDLGEAAESPGVRMELKDVWEEIATLARGEVPGREADPVRGPASVDADAILHEKHTEVAVPSRPVPAKRPHEFVLHSPELAGRPQKELRRAQKRRGLLSGVKGGAKNSLREAIILAEVLSPPVVLRDPGWKPQF